jgi:hypothetical protein
MELSFGEPVKRFVSLLISFIADHPLSKDRKHYSSLSILGIYFQEKGLGNQRRHPERIRWEKMDFTGDAEASRAGEILKTEACGKAQGTPPSAPWIQNYRNDLNFIRRLGVFKP